MSGILYNTSAGVTYATWNPADKSSNIALSGGNLTADGTGGAFPGGQGGVRSTISKSAGKWYWEISIQEIPADLMCAIALNSYDVNAYPGFDFNSWGYYGFTPANAGIYNNGVKLSGALEYGNGDIVGVALDAGGNTVDFFVGNVSAAGTVSLPGGPYFACVGVDQFTALTTTNFGATPFTFAPPAGYNAGLYT